MLGLQCLVLWDLGHSRNPLSPETVTLLQVSDLSLLSAPDVCQLDSPKGHSRTDNFGQGGERLSMQVMRPVSPGNVPVP